jgi:hypothetical protein
MPIPPDARGALQLVPLSDKLNRFMLTVTGLKGEKYDVAIDGTRVATVTAQQLAAGWNMSELTDGPIAKQCGDVLVLISKKAAPVSAYRTVRKFQIPEWLKDPENTGETKRKAELDRLMPQITALDAELAKTCQPQPHRFEVTAAK